MLLFLVTMICTPYYCSPPPLTHTHRGCLFLKVLIDWVLLQIFRILMRMNVRVVFILVLLGLGAVFYVGARTSPIIVFVFTVCIISFLISIYLTKWVLSKDEGPPEMVQVQLGPMFLAPRIDTSSPLISLNCYRSSVVDVFSPSHRNDLLHVWTP